MLTGNEGKIAARHLHQGFFEFVPTFKLVFVGNVKPRINTVDEAVARRLNLVPFRWPPAQRDERLKERLAVEYPAILRWAIDGWLDLQANGPVRPVVITEATAEYLTDENMLAGWLAERCELGPLNGTLLKQLFADWKHWCEANHEDAETSRKFHRRLDRLVGVRCRRDMHGVWIKGLGLKP